jgi:hypothetical protein
MSTTPVRDTQFAPEDAPYIEDDRGGGWVLFAGVMLALLATLNLVDGIAAVADSRVFVADATFVLGDLNTLGWVLIAIGVVQALTAIGVWTRTPGVRWVGVTIAALNAIAQMLFLPAYPVWSMLLFAVAVLVIYGLVVYGARLERA